MKKSLFTLFLSVAVVGLQAQNLALTATPTASASSAGSYGPANWTNGVINGATFGWVGTDPNTASFPQPAWIQLEWSNAQTINELKIFNAGTNFAPPTGNAVIFTGTANLEYWDGAAWILINQVTGQGTYGTSYSITFPTVITTKIRLHQITTSIGSHNPGFDEFEVYFNIPQVVDLALKAYNLNLVNISGSNPEMEVEVQINNMGTLPVSSTSFTIQYRLSNQPLVWQSGTQGIPPGDSILITFNTRIPLQTVPSPLANDELCLFVHHPQDIDGSNDSICNISLAFLRVDEYDNGQVGIYPNPTAGTFYINTLKKVSQLTVYDMSGKAVFSQTANHPLHHFRVDESLKNGHYIILVIYHDGEVSTGRITIDKAERG